MKQHYVNKIVEGDAFDDTFVVKDIQERKKKNGDPYWILVLGDKTGEIEGKLWEQASSDMPVKDDYVKVRAEVKMYRGKLDMTVSKIRRLVPERDSADFCFEDFLPTLAEGMCSRSTGNKDRSWIMGSMQGMLEQEVTHAGLRAVCSAVFTDPALHSALRDAPAAATIHQAYIGGLIEHSHNMLRIADFLIKFYQLESPSSCLLRTACLFHDIGKIKELQWSRAIGYTTEGRLIGHLGLGLEILDRLRPVYWEAMDAVHKQEHGKILESGARFDGEQMILERSSLNGPTTKTVVDGINVDSVDWSRQHDINVETWVHLRHLICSHHGRKEWRAITEPASREANLFHLIDMIDSRMGMMDMVERTEKLDEDGFTRFIPRLEGNAWSPKC